MTLDTLIELLDDLRAEHGGQRTCLLKSYTWSSSGELTHEENRKRSVALGSLPFLKAWRPLMLGIWHIHPDPRRDLFGGCVELDS